MQNHRFRLILGLDLLERWEKFSFMPHLHLSQYPSHSLQWLKKFLNKTFSHYSYVYCIFSSHSNQFKCLSPLQPSSKHQISFRLHFQHFFIQTTHSKIFPLKIFPFLISITFHNQGIYYVGLSASPGHIFFVFPLSHLTISRRRQSHNDCYSLFYLFSQTLPIQIS